MKSNPNKFSYLVEGLQTLHNVGLMFGYFIQPAPAKMNDFYASTPSSTGELSEVRQWSLRATGSKGSRRDAIKTTEPSKAIDFYFNLINPLLKAMEFSVLDGSLNASQLKELIIENFFALEKEHSQAFVAVAKKNKGKFSGLIDRFNETTLVNAERYLNASNIVAVARGGYLLYREALSDKVNFEKLIWSIALIGWASLAISKTKECAFCPRRTSPGGQYCTEHGQTDLSKVGRTRSSQANKYRVGKNAYILALLLGLAKKPDANKKTRGDARQRETNSAESVVTRTYWMTSILFHAHLTWDISCDEQIRLALRHSPRVRRLIGGDTIFDRTYSEIVEVLRTTLNLFQLEERALPSSIMSMEDWLKCEEQVRLDVRGFGQKAYDRINQAITLAKQGRTRTEIARALGVRQSTVTLWTKKSPELSAELNCTSSVVVVAI